jgi:hypothetical protein
MTRIDDVEKMSDQFWIDIAKKKGTFLPFIRIDMSDRICSICKSDETRVRKRVNWNGTEMLDVVWHYIDKKLVCDSCFKKVYISKHYWENKERLNEDMNKYYEE